MKHYELLYILPGKYTEEEMEGISVKINELVKKHGGEITLTDNLGAKKLAYPIADVQVGNYLVIEFNSEPEKIKELGGELKLTPEVLRFGIILKKLKTQEEIDGEKIRKEKMAQKQKAEETKAEPAPKVSLEELDKKLGEILEGDII
ncbi:30S ribosomal protein S6 [Patescibacteria group bacterium]|nr:30S ribosomal protein S6 [Patescibacteria group bacterium]